VDLFHIASPLNNAKKEIIMSKFNLKDWSQSLRYFNINNLDQITKNDSYSESNWERYWHRNKKVPDHIRFACFYLSIIDKIMIKWIKETPGHTNKGFGIIELRRCLLAGKSTFHNLNFEFPKDLELWK